jgi:hypothetical protein
MARYMHNYPQSCHLFVCTVDDRPLEKTCWKAGRFQVQAGTRMQSLGSRETQTSTNICLPALIQAHTLDAQGYKVCGELGREDVQAAQDKSIVKGEGVFYANFCSKQNGWTACQKVWWGVCYCRPSTSWSPMKAMADKKGDDQTLGGDEQRFRVTRNGDLYLMCPFQRDLCHV